MGIDFEVIAYRGKPASVTHLAGLMLRFTPFAELFRHAVAEDVNSPVAHDLHMIAFYDDHGGYSDDDTDEADDTEEPDDVDGKPSIPEPAEPNCAEIARELSQGGEAFLLGYADHSLIGIYAQFRDGELVSPASVDEIYAEHDDYVAWPSQQWSRALGKNVDLRDIVARYFPDSSAPPLCRVDRPNRAIPFDADRYAIGISESI